MKRLWALVFFVAMAAQATNAQQPTKGKALTPELAPVYSPAATSAPIMLQPSPKLAAPLSLRSLSPATSGPVIDCRVPVSRIGSIAVPGGEAIIKAGNISIVQTVSMSGDPVLNGRVLRMDDSATTSGAERQMSGLVLFQSGDLMSQLVDPTAPQEEMVFRMRGSVTGQIVDVSDRTLTLRDRNQLQKIDLRSISYVRSPRAFIFTIYGKPSSDGTRTRVQEVSFHPTLEAVGMGDEVVAGKRLDPLDISDDEDVMINPALPPIMRMRQMQNDNLGPYPLKPWP